jgi:hypothetical protein
VNILGADPFEIFGAAYGESPNRAKTGIDPLLLVDMLQKLALNPELIELVQNAVKIQSPEHRKTILEAMRMLSSSEFESKTGNQTKK